MIKMFSAFTEEIDDAEGAVSEILGKLDLERSLLKNSVGILHCYHEFIESGVVSALCEKAPFDVIGITVPYICLSGKKSSLGLMFNVLTSDDADFVTGISDLIEPGGGNLAEATEGLCRVVSEKLEGGEKPKMIMAFGPFMHVHQIDGDEFVDRVSGFFTGAPVFGGFSFSEEMDFSNCFTIYNGEAYERAAGLIALSGDVNPSFLTISVPEKNIVGEMATVTKSGGNILHEINGMTVEDYVIDMGLMEQKGNLEKLYSTPIIAKIDDGTTLVRVCIGGDGHGGAVMGGHVPLGAKIGFTMLEVSDTIATAKEIAEKAKKNADGRNIIVYTCMARLDFFGARQRELEAETVCGIIGDSDNFYLAYTGGEIFPHRMPGGEYVNHLQNFSLIVCMF